MQRAALGQAAASLGQMALWSPLLGLGAQGLGAQGLAAQGLGAQALAAQGRSADALPLNQHLATADAALYQQMIPSLCTGSNAEVRQRGSGYAGVGKDI
jgi:alpha-beta hydrolase superfamily lysophospholipase